MRALDCKYGIRDRDLAEMMQERGVMSGSHHHSMGAALCARDREPGPLASELSLSVLAVGETYLRVGGAWKYLFRAIDKTGRLIGFMLSDRRNTRAAHLVMGKAQTTMRNWPPS